jgi:hypothetical protein
VAPRSEQLTAEALLHGLLDRVEDGRLRTRALTQKIDYLRVDGPAAQDTLHRVLEDAARMGAVALERDRLAERTGEYTRIRLKDADTLYRYLHRTPSLDAASKARQSVLARLGDLSKDEKVSGAVVAAENEWRINKRRHGFGVNDEEAFATALRLAHGILSWSGPDIDHRTFSRRLVNDSKALERQEGRVAALMREWLPALPGELARETFEACGVVRRAHPLFLRGPLEIDMEGFQLRGGGAPFIGLPLPAIKAARLSRPASYVIIIENPTSFWRYCNEMEGDYLALLSDGFPARDVLQGIVTLVRAARRIGAAPAYHWGDIDAGGVRIAAHLEDALETPLRLHEMSQELARKHGGAVASKAGLKRLAERGGELGALAAWLLSPDGRAMEQEALDPSPPAEFAQ